MIGVLRSKRGNIAHDSAVAAVTARTAASTPLDTGSRTRALTPGV